MTMFIKIDELVYFEYIFKKIYDSNKINNFKILFIFSSRIKNLLKKYDYDKKVDYLFVDEIGLTKLNFIELIKYFKKSRSIKTKKCINLVFWSKFNWSNFFFRNILADEYISFELFNDLLPNFIKKLKIQNPNKVIYPFKDKKFKNLSKFPLPVKGFYHGLLNNLNH